MPWHLEPTGKQMLLQKLQSDMLWLTLAENNLSDFKTASGFNMHLAHLIFHLVINTTVQGVSI